MNQQANNQHNNSAAQAKNVTASNQATGQQHYVVAPQANQGIWSKFEKGDKIGEGTYGYVFHARSKENGGHYAIKQFKTGREGEGVNPTAIREILLLRELRHENIVRLDSVHINRAEASLFLAFEYAEHDLYEMLKLHRDHRDLRRENPYGLMHQYTLKSVMWQLLNGLNFMHQNWVIHRDLKPSNVLVMADDAPGGAAGQVRIGDFGLARIFQSPLRPLSDNGVVVTIWYRAPELLLGSKHYTRAVDIWAAGCLFAELMMLRPLFQGQERKHNAFQADQVDKIFRVLGHPSSKTWPELEKLPNWYLNMDNVRVRQPEYATSPLALDNFVMDSMRSVAPSWANGSVPQDCRPSAQAFDLMRRMLDYNPATRITAAEALQHEWFQQAPLPGPNIFRPPGAKDVLVRYPKRTLTVHGNPQPDNANASAAATGATARQGTGPSGPVPVGGSRTGPGRGIDRGAKRKHEALLGFGK